MTGAWRAATASHAGWIRERNEDACAAEPARGLFLVADGLGGHAGGDVASALARDAVIAAVAAAGGGDPLGVLRRAVARANDAVRARAGAEPALAGMGTTLTAVLAPDGTAAAFAHVGDSRLYRFRAGRLEAISHDQTVAMRLVREGLLDADSAPASPYWHLLDQAIGLAPAVAPECGTVAVRPGDMLLLASDGLTDMLSEVAIAALLADAADPAKAAAALLSAALDAGGHDNVTVVVASRQA